MSLQMPRPVRWLVTGTLEVRVRARRSRICLYSCLTYFSHVLTATRVLHELGNLLAISDVSWHAHTIRETHLASILVRLVRREITNKTSRQLLAMLFNGDKRQVEQIIRDENLFLRPMTDDEYVSLAQKLLDDNTEMVRAIKEKNQKGKISWFVGQMIRQAEEGRVEADRARTVVENLMNA